VKCPNALSVKYHIDEMPRTPTFLVSCWLSFCVVF
jgi:hypothetical protein